MALIDCPECSTQVSSAAISCPKCGYPIERAVVAEDAPVLRDGGPVLGDDSWRDFPIASELEKQGQPQAAPVPPAADTQATKSRKIGVLLGAGIVFLPFIFAWFTLREGYSTKARAMSFAWLALLVVGTVGEEMEKGANRDTATREVLGETARAPVAPPPESPEPKWYEGGTLHRAKVSQWVSATEKNRVATCADFVAAFLMENSSASLQAAYEAGVEEGGHDTGMKYATLALYGCLNEATTDFPSLDAEKFSHEQQLSDMAAACIVLMDAQLP